MQATGLKQRDFSEIIGKSQAQVSKYLSGKTEVPDYVNIHCVNIIREHSQLGSSVEELLFEIQGLEGEEHRSIREALMGVISAYKNRN
ncbi:helix-turn-helix transcriptional regulator [Brenneria sp. MC1SB4.1]|uniref:Helix-turn-helix transcriptional regulator n=2 Tax=Brenneria tiliae TaxID=2914984 RepID=A0ABT0MV62_9GAMM|nr:helix-turn-helix transcriptional regulator [Brenneria tiliae]